MNPRDERGYALITALMLLALLMALLIGYFSLTAVDRATTRSTMDSMRGFYAAEAGLNIRSEGIRSIFNNYNMPSGSAPIEGGVKPPCATGNLGSGDYACVDQSIGNRTVSTYMSHLAGSPRDIVIPRGEPYQNLNAQEYRYQVNSTTFSSEGHVEAELQLRVNSRLVPLFQFAIFFNKDLEVTPGPAMSLSGPVHTNGDLFLAAYTSVDVDGQVTSAGDMFRGRKEADLCWTGPFRVADPSTLSELPTCSSGRRLITGSDVSAWNGMVKTGVDLVEVPQPDELTPVAGKLYWDRADVRIMLDVNSSPTIELRKADGTLHAESGTLNGCGAVSTSNSFYNNREGAYIRMLDVDMTALFNCIHNNPNVMDGKLLNDATDRGLVFYFGVDGPDSGTLNAYGVRMVNGDELASTAVGAPDVRGLTVVTDQAAYVQGHYNRLSKEPAAILADSINVLSNSWADSDSTQSLYASARDASTTTINAAFLSGTDTTGNAEGVAGRDIGSYSGGVHNLPRMHEDWNGVTLTYRGSLVSLNMPLHVDGGLIVGSPQYSPPIRDYNYDTDFNVASNLPPLTPRFTYLKQNMFMRKFEP